MGGAAEMRRGEEWGADRTGEEIKKKWRRKKEECRAERLRDPAVFFFRSRSR